MDPVIWLEGVTKIYGADPDKALDLVRQGRSRKEILAETDHVLALNDVNLEVSRGEVFVVMGLSGSGKSTLVRCINRLVDPTVGKIFVDGVEVTRLPRGELLRLRSEKLGMVFQHFALLPHRNVLDNVAFGLEVQREARSSRHEKAREALRQVGLEGWGKRLPAELSGGMQQRVGLARALALDPPILLMDEPFSGLDPLIRKEMQRELLGIQQHVRKTIVFITHDLDEAMTIGDRIAVLRDGRIEQLGSPQEIILSPSSDYVSAFVRDVNFLKVLTVGSAMEPAANVYRLGERIPSPAPATGGDDGLVLITDSDGRYVGILLFSRLADAAGAGPEALRRSLSTAPSPLHPKDPLRNALETVARPPFVVPVTDAAERLLGVVTRESVLAMLTRQRG